MLINIFVLHQSLFMFSVWTFGTIQGQHSCPHLNLECIASALIKSVKISLFKSPLLRISELQYLKTVIFAPYK